jgi:hypothetical protein
MEGGSVLLGQGSGAGSACRYRPGQPRPESRGVGQPGQPPAPRERRSGRKRGGLSRDAVASVALSQPLEAGGKRGKRVAAAPSRGAAARPSSDDALRHVTWGGELENQERAMHRLALVTPLSIFLMFLLLGAAGLAGAAG